MSSATTLWIGKIGRLVLWISSAVGCAIAAQDPAPVRAVRLRTADQGPFTELRVGSTTLRAAPGHANLDGGRGVDGWHCLHLCRRDAEAPARIAFHFDPPVERPHRIRFGAERWTRNAPFRCVATARGASEADVRTFPLDDRVRVGRVFPSVVELDVDGLETLAVLEFEVTAPVGTGLLLDDVLVVPRGPLRIVGEPVPVTPTTPVLRGTDGNVLAAVRIDVAGTDGTLGLRGVDVDLSAVDDPADLDLLAVEVVPTTGPDAAPERLAARTDPAEGTWRARGEVPLRGGTVTVRVVASCASAASLDRRVGARILAVDYTDGHRQEVERRRGPRWQRIGVPLRVAEQGGVHTSRIPGLATTPKGTLLAVFDLRHRSGGDLPGDIDVGLRRSTDGGRTWSRTRAILDMGEPHAANGVGDPTILVDDLSGRVWVFALWSRGDRGWHGSGPGLAPDETGQLVCVTSDDDGLTWSEPRNLTREVKDPQWRLLFNGPGRGITTWDGTLVLPAQYRDAEGVPHSTVIWSEDRGEHWSIGRGAKPDTTEAQVVELADRSWMLNCRDNRGGARAVLVTSDHGASWTTHPSSRTALPEPVCMASLLRVPFGEPGLSGDLLAFSNPAVSAPPRRHLTLKLSRDEGASWPETMHLRLDDLRSAGYSCLTMVDERTLGILYEGGRAHLVFQRIPLSAVLVE